MKVCLQANSLVYPEGGGHLWVYLNWALGFQSIGCQVIWMEAICPTADRAALQADVNALRAHLEPYGFAQQIALCSFTEQPLPASLLFGCLDIDAALTSDLFLNVAYGNATPLIAEFRRSALLDIDPGLLQTWLATGQIAIHPHDVYFTIGETVGQKDALFPDGGLTWLYTPPCVSLDAWGVRRAPPGSAFTTITHWSGEEWVSNGDEYFLNTKECGFRPFLDLPRHVQQPLELAICLGDDEDEERQNLRKLGWRVADPRHIASSPWAYQEYVQNSLGEFSCAKPSCVHFQNAWISDRTLCYLASGKPAVVQHTGPSRFLPDSAGLYRFRDLDQAVKYVELVCRDYDRHSALARNLAEEFFDAKKVATSLLERALS